MAESKKREQKDLQQKLKERKYRIPNRFIYGLYYYLSKIFILRKYKPHITIQDDINDCKGPCFLIWNHLSRLDHAFLLEAAYPRRINIVAGYVEFFRSHLHTVFRLNQILPKKNLTQDIAGLKAMQSILNQGGCVCFSPEGCSSIYGTNQPVVYGTGHYLKYNRVPVYFLECHGQYLTNTKVCLDERIGRTEATMKLLFTPEQLDQMTDEEVEDKVNEAFRFDDYEWGRAHRMKWTKMENSCTRLDDICYKCPKCGEEMKMVAKGDTIRCSVCGNGARVNEYYEFEPFEGSTVPKSPSEWVLSERKDVIRAIRADQDFSYSVETDLGYLPTDHWIPKKQASEPCGSGTFTVDHQGMHYRGTRLGEPYQFDLSYEHVYSLTIEVATDKFGVFVNGVWHEFTPKEHATGKILLITEEMHRLHFNLWKNFPWNQYLYKEQ